MDAAIACSLVVLLASSSYVSFSLTRPTIFERVVVAYLFFLLQVLLVGYTISILGHFSDSLYWLGGSILFGAICVGGVLRLSPSLRHDHVASEIQDSNNSDRPKHFPLLIVLGITAALMVAASGATAVLTAPHNIDSHTCHLARTAHFMQRGTLDWYPTNMWAQVTHPRNHPILLAYAWKLGGENATQLVNFSAWLISGFAIWGIVFNMLNDRVIAWSSAFLSMLLVNALMIATTTQNDAIVAVQSATTIYLFSAWYQSGLKRYLILVAAPLFICLGIKASTVLLLPALSLIGVATIIARHGRTQGRRYVPYALLFFSIASALIAAIPTGYVQNIPRYGHPLGPEHVRTGHTLESLSVSEKAVESGKNALRYVIDSTTLDGVKRDGTIDEMHLATTGYIGKGLKQLGWDLEQNDHSKRKFFFARPYRNHEDYSWWGIASLLLIWPSIAYCFSTSRRNKMAFIFALALVVFLICQSYAQYDPWRGRYFSWAIPIVIVPVASLTAALLKRRVGQTYLMIVVVAICFASCRSVLYRTNGYLIEKRNQQSIFAMDRIGQLCRNNPELAPIVKRYEEEVPQGSKVAMALSGNHFLYPFYGQDWERFISYISPHDKAINSLSEDVDFVIYSGRAKRITRDQRDILLGTDSNKHAIYLRRQP